MTKRKMPAWGAVLLTILFFPVFIIIGVCLLLYTPIGYLKFKNSRYHKDFGGKYSLFSGVHSDNEVYTVVKEKNLPVEYLKKSEKYEDSGYFVYNNKLFIFGENIFFNEEKGEWLWHDWDAEDDSYADIPIFQAEEKFLKAFHEDFPDKVCNGVVFFIYESEGSEEAMNLLKTHGNVFVAESGDITEGLEKYISEKEDIAQ